MYFCINNINSFLGAVLEVILAMIVGWLVFWLVFWLVVIIFLKRLKKKGQSSLSDDCPANCKRPKV